MTRKLILLLLPLLLITPLTGCLDEVEDILEEVEDFIEDLDDDHNHDGLTIIIGGDDDYDECHWDWWFDCW